MTNTNVTNMKEVNFLRTLKLPVYTEKEFEEAIANGVVDECRARGIFIDSDIFITLKRRGLDKSHILETLVANNWANGSWVYTDNTHTKIALCVYQTAIQQYAQKKGGDYIPLSNEYFDVAVVINR